MNKKTRVARKKHKKAVERVKARRRAGAARKKNASNEGR
jgi:hypothetical protein